MCHRAVEEASNCCGGFNFALWQGAGVDRIDGLLWFAAAKAAALSESIAVAMFVAMRCMAVAMAIVVNVRTIL